MQRDAQTLSCLDVGYFYGFHKSLYFSYPLRKASRDNHNNHDNQNDNTYYINFYFMLDFHNLITHNGS